MKKKKYSLGDSLIFKKVKILKKFPDYIKIEFIVDKKTNLKQEQIHDLLFKPEIRWQEIIYDLINTDQLDPWDINITILTNGYLEKIRELEEGDFFISSQVLLAAALLLRIKSELLLNRYINSIDEILFGRLVKGGHPGSGQR